MYSRHTGQESESRGSEGQKKAEINISDLAPATYIVVMQSGWNVAYERLIIN